MFAVSMEATDDAIEKLKAEYFDLIILNLDALSISKEEPPDTGAPIDFIETVRGVSPYITLLCVCAGDLTVEKAGAVLKHSHHEDLLSVGESAPNILVYSVEQSQSIAKFIDDMRDAIQETNSIDVNTSGKYLNLGPMQKRILRSFTAKFGGRSCQLKKLSNGISGAAVFQIVVYDGDSKPRIHALAKIDEISRADKELNNYQSEVSRLPTGNYPTAVARIPSASANACGIFFRLLEEDQPLSTLILQAQSRAAEVVKKINAAMRVWHIPGEMRKTKIKNIRKILLNDENLEKIVGTYPQLYWFDDIEEKEVMARWGSCHADLHSGNVFVNSDDKPVLIDFADIIQAPCALDPITLELSMYTHSPLYTAITWEPDKENMPWYDVDTYSSGSDYETFISACRNWAHEVAGGDGAVKACAYAYLIRQLKYNDVDHDRVLMLLESIRESITTDKI